MSAPWITGRTAERLGYHCRECGRPASAVWPDDARCEGCRQRV